MIDKTMQLPEGLAVVDLTKDFAKEHVDDLVQLANEIPMVDYTQTDILAEKKGDRVLYGKWLHGLAVVRPDGKPIAYVGAYERAPEGNDQYPSPTIYVSELAVSREYRRKGIANHLMQMFFQKNDEVGLKELDGESNYSVQTNSADWNQPVIGLYESFGFVKRATKEYPDRTDVVMGRGTNKRIQRLL